MKLYIKLFLVILTISLFSSCVDDKNYSEPSSKIVTYDDLVANKTLEDLILIYNSSTPTLYTNDDIIEGYVTSSDETGNFFNIITFQSSLNTSTNSPIGFSVSVELESFDKGFTPGRKVYIKLKDLYIAKVDGSISIGSIYNGDEIGRISKYDWQNRLFPSSTIVDESSLVRTVTLQEASSDIRLNTLLDISNVQFADGSLERTLYDIDSGGGATNHLIVAATGGNVKYLRTSSYSLLKGKKVPFGRGTIRGIMTKYGDDYQFVIRYYNDLKLTDRRTYNFRSSFTENFNTFSAPTGSYNELRSIYAFKDYVNFATEGTKNWFIRDNSFLEMSAFSGNVEKNKCFFMVPVNMTEASTFSFKFKFQFYSSAGTPVKIYRTSNYVYGMKFSDVTLVDISSSFLLPSATTDSFGSAGVYNIPESVTGNDFFVFVYTGTNITTGPSVTTTVQIDDIVVN